MHAVEFFLRKPITAVQLCQDTFCCLWHTNIPICCSQQQIAGRYAEPEECSPQHQHKKACRGKEYVKWGDKK